MWQSDCEISFGLELDKLLVAKQEKDFIFKHFPTVQNAMDFFI